MSWSIFFYMLIEHAQDDADALIRKEAKVAEKERAEKGEEQTGVLAQEGPTMERVGAMRDNALRNFIDRNSEWLGFVFEDAISFARVTVPRGNLLNERTGQKQRISTKAHDAFYCDVWPSLEMRGWTKETKGGQGKSAKTLFLFKKTEVRVRA